jgi:carboxyl-terminal processing protease
MVVPLGRLLLSQAADLGAMHMREGKQTFNVAAGTDPFTGPLVILVDEGTASTSEIFAQALQDLGRATVFGAVPSQGAALPSVIEELPGGGMLQYVVADYQSPKGQVVEGKGVTPDTVVPETRQDFAKGRDPVLDAAVAALRGG